MKRNLLHHRISILLSIFLLAGVACTNQEKATGSCEKYTDGDGLLNCKKSSCTGKCMLQVGTIDKDKGDTTWRDIPGGNLNPKDVKDNQITRCDCR